MKTLSMTVVFAILAWTISLNLAHAQPRDHRDVAICEWIEAQVADLGHCEGHVACALKQRRTQITIIRECMDELGWKAKIWLVPTPAQTRIYSRDSERCNTLATFKGCTPELEWRMK
jgi:hypothetical protein